MQVALSDKEEQRLRRNAIARKSYHKRKVCHVVEQDVCFCLHLVMCFVSVSVSPQPAAILPPLRLEVKKLEELYDALLAGHHGMRQLLSTQQQLTSERERLIAALAKKMLFADKIIADTSFADFEVRAFGDLTGCCCCVVI